VEIDTVAQALACTDCDWLQQFYHLQNIQHVQCLMFMSCFISHVPPVVAVRQQNGSHGVQRW